VKFSEAMARAKVIHAAELQHSRDARIANNWRTRRGEPTVPAESLRSRVSRQIDMTPGIYRRAQTIMAALDDPDPDVAALTRDLIAQLDAEAITVGGAEATLVRAMGKTASRTTPQPEPPISAGTLRSVAAQLDGIGHVLGGPVTIHGDEAWVLAERFAGFRSLLSATIRQLREVSK